MPQVAVRINLIADPLLQHFGFRETAVSLALPDLHVVTENVKHPTGAGHQLHFAEVVAKRAEQFLGQPGSTQQPLALRAIRDDDFRFACSHDRRNS